MIAREINEALKRDPRSVFCFTHPMNAQVYRVLAARTRKGRLQVRVVLEARETWLEPHEVWEEK